MLMQSNVSTKGKRVGRLILALCGLEMLVRACISVILLSWANSSPLGLIFVDFAVHLGQDATGTEI